MKYPKPNMYLDEKEEDHYPLWAKASGLSKKTITQYLYALKAIPENVKAYLVDDDTKCKNMKYNAYRSYLKFLNKERKLLSRSDLLDALESLKAPKKRGNNLSDRKWSIPKTQWATYIRKGPTSVAKMGVWLGFHFGLRLGEILHLRIEDVDFNKKEINIKIQEDWNPKYNRERQIPFTSEQAKTLKKWINEVRSLDLHHSYLLWTVRGPRKGLIVQDRAFQRWCTITGLHAHVLRYSFATHYYNESKDVKLISDLLGHANVSTTSDYLQLGQKETMTKARKLFSDN